MIGDTMRILLLFLGGIGHYGRYQSKETPYFYRGMGLIEQHL